MGRCNQCAQAAGSEGDTIGTPGGLMGTRTALIGLLLVFCMLPSSAQEQGAQRAPPKTVFERNTQPIELFKTGLGGFTRPISSSNKEAQAFFDQGFQMMYAFAKPEAIRSFREA